MLRVVLGPARSGKTSFIMDEISKKVAGKKGGNILIVPEQYSHEAERELCKVSGDSLSLYGEVLSFTRLAARVSEELGRSKIKYLDKGGRLITMTLAIQAVQSQLRIYGGARRQRSIWKELLSAIDDFKTACISPDMLEDASRVCSGKLQDKLSDMAIILGAYDAITSQGEADPSDRLTSLYKDIRYSTIHGDIYVDGFVDFTAQELEVLYELLKKELNVTVCLNCDALDSGLEIFNASRLTAGKLLYKGKELGIESKVTFMEQLSTNKELDFISNNLFTYTANKVKNSGAVVLNKALSITDECEMAAAMAKRFVMETGCRYRDIAIAARGFDEYGKVLENVFSYYDIPLYISKKSKLINRSAPALICAVMEIINGGWEYDAVCDYLKTGLTELSQDQSDELENYVYLWSIKGAKIWTRDDAWTQNPEGYGAPDTERSQNALERIDKLRRKVSMPIHKLEAYGKKAETATAHAEALSNFLVDIKLPEKLYYRAKTLHESGKKALAMEYRQIWEITVNALEQSAVVLGDMPMSQAEFFSYFKELLSQYEIGTIPISLDSVQAGDMDRMRRRNIRHLIILGASDDRLPKIKENTGIFTQEDKEHLNSLSIKLGESSEGELYREMNLIYHCITLPSETLTMSYVAGDDNQPAFVVSRVSALTDTPIRSLNIDEIKSYSILPAMSLYTKLSKTIDYVSPLLRDKGINITSLKKDRERGYLSRNAVEKLYGENLSLSASRAEVLSSCRFQYFMKYGLRVKPRKPAGFSGPEMGRFMHYVLEAVSKEIMDNGGFSSVDNMKLHEVTEKHIGVYIKNELNDFKDKSPRFIYLFKRLVKTVYTVIADMLDELRGSKFEPLDFELSFSKDGDLSPVELSAGDGTLEISGIADRVDGWIKGDTLYLRVVDYKTGKKKFSLSDVWYGMGLQMLMYLFSLQKSNRYYREIVPAGVMYIPARDVLISAPSNLKDEDIIEERRKKLVRSGLILDEPEVIKAMEDSPRYLPVKFNKEGVATGDCLASLERLGAMSRHVERTLKKLGTSLRQGCIDADPFYKNPQEDACLWCDYYQACHFDQEKDHRRYMKKLSAKEVWEKIAKDDQDNKEAAEWS